MARPRGDAAAGGGPGRRRDAAGTPGPATQPGRAACGRVDREPWLAVDPKVSVGPPEYGLPELLWGRYHRLGGHDAAARALDLVVRTAGLDADLARAWATVRTLDFLLWSLAHGITSDREGRRPLLDHLL